MCRRRVFSTEEEIQIEREREKEQDIRLFGGTRAHISRDCVGVVRIASVHFIVIIVIGARVVAPCAISCAHNNCE